MAMDKPRAALTLLRICIGIFFLFEGIAKIGWLVDASILARQFAGWSQAAAAGSVSAWYLARIAVPGVSAFARLVPLGEMCSGIALLVGLWTPLFAFAAFLLALKFP